MQRSPKDDPKLRRQGPAEPYDHEVDVPEAITCRPPRYSLASTAQTPTVAENTRGRRSADARTLKKYGRTRGEIDAFISEHYATAGPKWVAEHLGVRITTVIMRARKLGLPPLR
jgi:hypothetical protein